MESNQKIGMWTLIKPATDQGTKDERWLCTCDCGTTRLVRTRVLKERKSLSCGCRAKASHRSAMASSFKEAPNGIR